MKNPIYLISLEKPKMNRVTHHKTIVYHVDIDTGEQLQKNKLQEYRLINTIKNKSFNHEAARIISYTKQYRRKEYKQQQLF